MWLWTPPVLAAPPASPALSDPAFAAVSAGRALGPGATGPAVEAIQAILTVVGCCEGERCRSGQYDESTERGVREWTMRVGFEPADGRLDAPELGLLDERLRTTRYAPIRAAGSRGLRYDVPIAAGATADTARQALVRTAFPLHDATAILENHADLLFIGMPTAEEVAAGRIEVWLDPDVVRRVMAPP